MTQAQWQQWEGSLAGSTRVMMLKIRVELGGYSLWDVGYHLTQQFKVDGRLANVLDKYYETTQDLSGRWSLRLCHGELASAVDVSGGIRCE